MSETPKAEPVAKKASSKDSPVDVEPHHASADPEAARQYTDIALTGLFNAHAVLIASERQAIWTRYTAMMMGNAIVIGFLSQQIERAGRAAVGCVLGIVLCACWFAMLRHGYELFSVQISAAMRFSWQDAAPNPVTELWDKIYDPTARQERRVPSGGIWVARDWIRIGAYGVILIFLISYVSLGALTFMEM